MKEILHDFIKGKSYEKLLEESEKQGISALVFSAIYDRDDIPEDLRERFVRLTRRTILQGDRLIFETVKQVRLLEKAGIRCIVLKGVAMARYYPSVVLRRSGDIDIFVPDETEYDRAGKILTCHGFVKEEVSYSLHHTGYTGPGGIETELHSMLLEPFDDSRVNRLITGFEKNIQTTRAMVRPGIYIPVLSDRDNAVYLMLHLLSHYLGEGMSLRQLTDISMILNHITDDADRRFFSDFMINAGLKTFATAVCGYCRKHLGLRASHDPMAEWSSIYDERMDEQISYAVSSGDFGHHGADQMAVPSTATAGGLAATFITQVKRQHPQGWKNPLKRPFLCISVLVGFIRNNRKIRRVSTISVLHDAISRGRGAGTLKVFRDDKSFHVKASGNSMWPFIHDGDEVCIKAAEGRLHRYTIVLYRRDNGMKVLHRIIKITPEGYYMAGDNQTDTEGPVPPDHIIGVLDGFYRNGRYVNGGFAAGKIWASLGPLRKVYRRLKNAFKR